MVLQLESESLSFESSGDWPGCVRVAVPFYHQQRPTNVLNWNQYIWPSDVAEVPDFVGFCEAVQ